MEDLCVWIVFKGAVCNFLNVTTVKITIIHSVVFRKVRIYLFPLKAMLQPVILFKKICIPCWNICFTFGLCDFASLTNSICQLVENSILKQWKAANKLAHRSHILTKLKTLNINLKSCKTRGILKRRYCQLCSQLDCSTNFNH